MTEVLDIKKTVRVAPQPGKLRLRPAPADYWALFYGQKWWLILFPLLAVTIACAYAISGAPVRPVHYVAAALGATVCTVVGILAMASAEPRFRRLSDLRTTGAPVAGVLPSVPGWEQSGPHLIRSLAPGEVHYALSIEALRKLVVSQIGRGQSLLVVSPAGGEGRSSIAANLAMSITEATKRVLLIDADQMRPALHRLFLPGPAVGGFARLGAGEMNWRDAIVKHASYPRIDVLPAGQPAARKLPAAELQIRQLLQEAGREYDLVLLDSAPLLRSPDVVDLAKSVDAVLLVVRAGETTGAAVASTLSYLRRLDANVLGIVLNAA